MNYKIRKSIKYSAIIVFVITIFTFFFPGPYINISINNKREFHLFAHLFREQISVYLYKEKEIIDRLKSYELENFLNKSKRLNKYHFYTLNDENLNDKSFFAKIFLVKINDNEYEIIYNNNKNDSFSKFTRKPLNNEKFFWSYETDFDNTHIKNKNLIKVLLVSKCEDRL